MGIYTGSDFLFPFVLVYVMGVGDRPRVIVVGAGPAGCLAALLLAEEGADVSLYDLRADLRASESDGTDSSGGRPARPRSINLALSTRGLSALTLVGLSKEFETIAIPMHGRCVHLSDSTKPSILPYGQPGQFLLSVSRVTLTEKLVDACTRHPSVSLYFRHKCTAVDLKASTATFEKEDGSLVTEHATLIVGADGAFSRVRSAMARRPRFDYSQTYISAAYKELNLVALANDVSFPQNALHIWPRGSFMLIALPNPSSNDLEVPCTATLFLPHETFEKLDSEESVRSFFEEYFPDALPRMPTLTQDFFANPTPSLLTIRCTPHATENAVLIGDAAHAIVPFYGQGCNAALEDCPLLAKSIRDHGWANISSALQSYAQSRKSDADAIADLALEHYHDMASRSASPYFRLKRRVEIVLNKFFPRTFLPLYTMISFSNIPYAQAITRAESQERVIGAIIATGTLCLAASVTAAAAFSIRRLKT